MPIQSKRISLTALGIENVPGMENGNHLRVGFDPRMGFPPCGFLLYRRAHETGETVALDWARLFDQQIPAPMRHGYLQDGIAVFHPNAPPPEGGENGLEVRDQIVCISFRTSPFVPDSTPKVCQVHLEISWDEGAVTVQAFDDRYDTGGFRKILVAHQEHSEPTEKAIDLRADLISLVEIKAPEGARLITFEYTIISELGWEPMDLPAESPWGNTGIPLLLPTPKFVNATSSSYPTCPELNFPQEASAIESDLPVSRLHTGFVARQSEEDFHGEYDDESRFFDVYLGPGRERITELIELLRALQEVPLAQQLQFTITNEGENNEEVTTIAPLSLILSGAVDYAFARLIGLAALDLDPPPNDAPSADYMVEARWDDEVGHFWITHDVFQGRDGLLNPPQPPEVTLVRDATRPEHVKTNVQLDWQAPDVIARLDRANQYAGYLVFRRQGEEVKDWVRLTQSHDELTDLFTPDLLLLGEIQGDAPAPPSSASAGHYLDRPPDYSQFQYGLQAQDLFGRRSEITWTEDIEVFELLEPPPVSDLFAFYLDTNDPVQSQAQLDANAAQILSVTGQSGFSGTALLISFRYPKASIQAVSSLLSFNISYRHGRPNEFLGTLAAPVIVGPPPALSTAPVLADIEFTTATPVPNGIDGFGGKRSRGALTSRGEFFAVQSATRLGTNLVRLRVKARRDYLPQKGEASLTIGRGGAGVTPHPLFVSPRDAFRWTGFDLRHPQGTGDQRPIRLSAANNTVLAPLPVAVTATQLVVSRTVEKPANLEPNEPSVASDWVYRVVVKNIELPLPTGLTEYFGSVTVQAISGSQRQSELPAPAYVQRRLYGAPPPLTELGTSEFVTAGRPDFEGRIGVVLTWPKIAGVQKFNVYRAEVPKLLDARGANPELAKDLFDNATNRAQVKLLGGQRASISSFTLATPVAITPETDPDAPTRHRWIDRVAAPREQSYVYRIQPLSVTGDEAPWPLDSAVPNENRNRCILVLQKNRDLLLPPAIYELEPLDRSIGVVVRDPRSESVTGLRIYKTDQPSLVHDVRSMTLIHGTIPFTHQRIQTLPATNGTPARLKFVDGKVQVGIQYFYRVMFVDEFGNQSQPSEPMAATPRSFAPPEPPALTAQRTATGTVNLSWQANHDEGQVKPQRKRSGEGEWIDLTPGWLTPTGTAVDTAATGIVAHRLLLRDARGRVVFSEVVITEA